jgi:glycosyltransferase involved in cell wall biosynthesis
MRHALVTLAHPQHAGMLRALRVLDDAAPRHGWELRYAFPAADPLLTEIGIPALRTTILPGLARWRRLGGALALPRNVLLLARLARGADALYSTTLSTFPLCFLAGRLARVPQLVHVYSSYGSARAYRKHWLGRARHVVAPSLDSLELARRAIGGFRSGTRARVVYNGMDVARIVREAEAEAELPAALRTPRGLRVGMLGNLDWRKNPGLLVEAAPAIRSAVPGVQLVLVGAFPDRDAEAALRARVTALGLEDTVVVTGFLANPFPVVRSLDVLVHPALRDPFPLALLEGMALARPIVASAVGGIPEMLVDGESGVLVPPDDAPALANAVVGLLRDEPRRLALGAAALARLRTQFSLDGFGDEMFEAFDQAVADGVA